MESARNKTFETTWSRLETVMNTDESYLYSDCRPRTTVSARKNTPASQRMVRQKKCLGRMSMSKLSRNRLKIKATDSFNIDPQVPGLNMSQVQDIYIAKCQDLGIPLLADQEKRFISYCAQVFIGRKFVMKEAGLSYRSAKVIGDIIKNSSYFAYVDLSKNSLKDFGAIKLVRQLALSSSIVHLDLSSNEISNEGSEMIIEILTGHESLISLDLSSHEGLHRNRLSLPGAQACGKMLKSFSVLTILNLAGTGIQYDGIEAIVCGLQGNEILFSLDLSNNMLGSKSIEKLATAVVESQLKILNLAFNSIGNEGCEHVAYMLSGGSKGFCNLAKLDLADNDITTGGLGKILSALRINNQVSYLTMKKNDFSKGLSSYFAQFLTENAAVEHLDLSNCEIVCDGLEGFEGLEKNTGLKVLNLSKNYIKDKGVRIICRGLCKNRCLKILDLSYNKIKNKGGISIARAVQENNDLECLNIKNNSLKDKSAEKFSELTRWKKNILKLNIEKNPLNIKYLDIIKGNIKGNYEFKQKMLIPRLHEVIGRLQIKGSAFENLQNQILQKKREKADVEEKLKTKGVKLEEVRLSEEMKLEELKTEYANLRQTSQNFSEEIEEIMSQINVKTI